MQGLEHLWRLLGSAGGGFALAFIVVIAVGLGTLTLLFGGAAVVVLERFARMARRPRTVAAVAFVWALIATALAIDQAEPDLFARAASGAGPELVTHLLAGIGSTAVAVVLVLLALRTLRRARLGAIAVLWVAVSFSAMAAGGAVPAVVATVAGVAAALWGALALRRRRGARGAAGGSERLAAAATGILVLGPVAAWLHSGGFPALLQAGGALLGLLLVLILLGLLPVAVAGFLDARGSIEWFIAGRYLFAKRRQTFISIITAICVGGVAAGVWLIISVLSVMNGFERTWRDEIIGNRAHFTVQSGLGAFSNYSKVLKTVLSTPGVVAASPYLDAEGMVRGDNGQILGVRVRGINPKTIGGVTDLRQDMVEGSLDALEPSALSGSKRPAAEKKEPPGIVIGSELASSFGLRIGDPLLVVSPFGGPPTPFGPAPRLERFRVVGVFRSSFFQYDEVFTYVDLPVAQAFRRSGNVVDGIEVRTTDFYRSLQIGHRVQARLGFPFFTRDWKEYFPAFFQALKTERVMMFVLLTMIMVVAAFIIVVTLVMMIMEKSGDIAILKTMGAEDDAVERIFAIEGALIGLLGTVLGVISGIAVTTRLDWIQHQVQALTGIDTLPASVYQLSTLPWEINPTQVAAVVAIAMSLALGATLLPSRQGAHLDPAEALRYE